MLSSSDANRCCSVKLELVISQLWLAQRRSLNQIALDIFITTLCEWSCPPRAQNVHVDDVMN